MATTARASSIVSLDEKYVLEKERGRIIVSKDVKNDL